MRLYIDNVLQDEVTSINLGTDPLAAFVIGSVSQTDWPTEIFMMGILTK
jgi:hypothetical protein